MVILMVSYVGMETYIYSPKDKQGFLFSLMFGLAMVVLVYLRAKAQKVSASRTLLFQTAMASVSCSVALIIVLQVALLFCGFDFFDLVSAWLIPILITVVSILFYPLCKQKLKE